MTITTGWCVVLVQEKASAKKTTTSS